MVKDKVFMADYDTINDNLVKLRENLIRAKSISEKELCLSSISSLNIVLNSLTNGKKVKYYDSVSKKNKTAVFDSINYISKNRDKFIDVFLDNKEYIQKSTKEYIDLYADSLCDSLDIDYYQELVFSEKYVLSLVLAFFKENFSENYDYVLEMIENKRILRADSIEYGYEGLCFNIYKSLPFIVVSTNKDKYSLSTVVTLIHELGHAIDFNNISKNYSTNVIEKYSLHSPYIEFMSRLYEKRAWEFLLKSEIDDNYVKCNLLDFHYTTYSNLLDAHVLSLLPDSLLKKDSYAKYDVEALKNLVVDDSNVNLVSDSFLFSYPDVRDNFVYGYSGLMATYFDSLIKDDFKSGINLYNKFLANRMDKYRPELLDELEINKDDFDKKLVKEICIFKN